MQFQNASLTTEGIRIFQRATANNNVVFTKFLFCGSPTTLTADMTELPSPTWGNGVVNNYAGGDNGDLILYASATNDTDYGYAYGYGVYGYLESEGSESEALLMIANYAGVVTYVSEKSGSYTRFHVTITMKMSLSASVISIEPHYGGLVSDTAFQNLANRVVTTHSAADETVGDDQEILGQKIFNGLVGFGSQVMIATDVAHAPSVLIECLANPGTANPYPSVRFAAMDGISSYGAAVDMTMPVSGGNPRLCMYGDVVPGESDKQWLGLTNKRWKFVNAKSVIAESTTIQGDSYILNITDHEISFEDDQSDPYGTIGVESGEFVITNDRGGMVTVTPGLRVNGLAYVSGRVDVGGILNVVGQTTFGNSVQCNDSVTIGQVNLSTVGSTLSINKSTMISGNLTATNLFASGNTICVNSSGGDPYYMGVYNGVLNIGATVTTNGITNGAIKTAQINASVANVNTLNVTGSANPFIAQRITVGGFDIIRGTISSDNFPIPTTGGIVSNPGTICLACISGIPHNTSINAGNTMSLSYTVYHCELYADSTSLRCGRGGEIGTGDEFILLSPVIGHSGEDSIALVMRK